MKRWKNKDWIYIFYAIVICAMSCVLMYQPSLKAVVIENGELLSAKALKIIVVISILLITVVSFLCGWKRNWKLENQYLLMALVIGIVYIFAIPYLTVPDEGEHFLRIFEISEGKFFSAQTAEGYGGNYLPANLAYDRNLRNYGDVFSAMQQNMDSNQPVWYDFSNTALYSPISYLPQIIGVFLAKLFTENQFFIIYSGRMFGYLFTVLAVFLSIRMLPFKKHVLFMIAFTPMFFQEAISLAGDSFTNAISILLISYVLNLTYGVREKIRNRDYVLVAVLCLLLSLCKIVYLPLVLIVFLIPIKKVGTKKKYFGTCIGIVAVAVAANLGWLVYASRYLIEFNPGVDSAEQVAGILHNPVRYLYICYNTLMAYGGEMLTQMFGSVMGWLDISNSRLLMICLLCLFSFECVLYNAKVEVRKTERGILGIILLAVIALIFTSLYVQWTPVGQYRIAGIQGRYFLPLLLMVPVVAPKLECKTPLMQFHKYLLPFLSFVNCYTIVQVVLYCN